MGPSAPFSAHTFDPATIRVLYGAYDSVWKRVEGRTDGATRDCVRDIIAHAIIVLARTGQHDRRLLEAYAEGQLHGALVRWAQH